MGIFSPASLKVKIRSDTSMSPPVFDISTTPCFSGLTSRMLTSLGYS